MNIIVLFSFEIEVWNLLKSLVKRMKLLRKTWMELKYFDLYRKLKKERMVRYRNRILWSINMIFLFKISIIIKFYSCSYSNVCMFEWIFTEFSGLLRFVIWMKYILFLWRLTQTELFYCDEFDLKTFFNGHSS